MSDLGTTFPPEIITDILSRLPVKPLIRFKCVSRSWNSLISDPYFIETHNNRTKTQNPKNLDLNIIFMNPRQKNLYPVDSADVDPTIKIEDFPLVEEHSDDGKWVLNSCDGLLLVMKESEDNITNFLLNPSTRECKKLPTPTFVLDKPLDICWYLCGLGYDSSTDDYKVVMLSTYIPESKFSTEHGITIVGIYSQNTDAWKRIQDTNYVLMDTSCGVFINGCVHCLCSRAGNCGSFLSVAFNLSDEVFKEVPLPASIRRDNGSYYRVAVLGGCLCLAYQQHEKTDFWIMKEYGVKESWTKFTIDIRDMYRVEVLSLLAEDEFLLKAKDYKLVVYNSKKETSRDMVINGFPKKFTFGSTYVESLVSPNRRGGIGRPWMRSFLRSANPRDIVSWSSDDIGQVTSLSVRPPGIAIHGFLWKFCSGDRFHK